MSHTPFGSSNSASSRQKRDFFVDSRFPLHAFFLVLVDVVVVVVALIVADDVVVVDSDVAVVAPPLETTKRTHSIPWQLAGDGVAVVAVEPCIVVKRVAVSVGDVVQEVYDVRGRGALRDLAAVSVSGRYL